MIDKKLAVGRIVLRDSKMRHGFFARGGVITRVSGTKVDYTDKNGDPGTCRRFSAVCDTPEEAEMLLQFSDKCWKSMERQHEINCDQANSLVSKN